MLHCAAEAVLSEVAIPAHLSLCPIASCQASSLASIHTHVGNSNIFPVCFMFVESFWQTHMLSQSQIASVSSLRGAD